MKQTSKLQYANLMALYIRDISDALKNGIDPKKCAEALEKLSGDYLLNKTVEKPVL